MVGKKKDEDQKADEKPADQHAAEEKKPAEDNGGDSEREVKHDATPEELEEARKRMEKARAEKNAESEEAEKKDPSQVHEVLPEVKNVRLVEEIRGTKEHLLESVKVYSPFKVYFDGPAKSISAINKTGPFDILPGHKNFMTLLTPCEVVIRTDAGEDKLKIERGVMHVRRNKINVFLDV